MVDPKDHVVAIGPKKGECYICNANLEKAPSIQIQKQIPIIKKMQSLGRACLPCAEKFAKLVVDRIQDAYIERYQA